MCGHKCFGARVIPRVFLSLLFLVSSINFMMHFADMTKTVSAGLTPVGLSGLAVLATLLAIAFQLIGGLLLISGCKTSLGAWMLVIFLTLATLMYHTKWTGAGGTMQMLAFLENIAVIGGLLHYATCPCKECREHCQGSCQSNCCGKKEETKTA